MFLIALPDEQCVLLILICYHGPSSAASYPISALPPGENLGLKTTFHNRTPIILLLKVTGLTHTHKSDHGDLISSYFIPEKQSIDLQLLSQNFLGSLYSCSLRYRRPSRAQSTLAPGAALTAKLRVMYTGGCFPIYGVIHFPSNAVLVLHSLRSLVPSLVL